VIAAILLIPGNTTFLGNLYSFGAMLSFTIAHLSIVALRLKHPEQYRPYRAPWNFNWRGKPVPLTAVLGAVGTGAAFLSVVALHTEARVIGTAWIVAGTIGYLLYRRRLGLDPRARYRAQTEQRPLDFLEVSYKSALVPIFGDTVEGDAMRRAAAIVDPDAVVEALYVLQVPPEHKLDAEVLAEQEYRARCALDVARLQARAKGLKVRVQLIRTRNPGKAIVEEARERRSDLIYISTDHAPSEERLLGPITRYVLAKRPCRVIVESSRAMKAAEGHPAGANGSAVATPIPVN
jgi:APA family basic amino acid/polyamine antiporter